MTKRRPISLPGSERIGHLRSDRKSTEVQGAQPKKRMMSKRTKHRLAGNALSSASRWVAFAGFASKACVLRSIRAGHADDQLNRSNAREGVCDPKGRRWEPILGLASLKGELERREELKRHQIRTEATAHGVQIATAAQWALDLFWGRCSN
jgi:hypothetical protein